MRTEESLHIHQLLRDLPESLFPSSCVNLGCGNVSKLKEQKPWIFTDIFDYLETKKCNVIHADIKLWPGVDTRTNLTDIESLSFTETLQRPVLFILANVLEHIPADQRINVVNNIYNCMQLGDQLLLSVPYSYPYHPDPIDTLYRPTDLELIELLPLEWSDYCILEAGSFWQDLNGMSPGKKIRKLLKPLWPFCRPRQYFSNLHRLIFLATPYKVTIAMGRKVKQ